MTTTFNTAQVHDLALAMYQHLKELEPSARRQQHMIRMICAVERSHAGELDDNGAELALNDIEAAGLHCQSAS